MLEQYVKMILNARVYEAAIETPLDSARILSERFNNHILLKREDLQPVFSFKIRGAYNKMAHLSVEQKAKGVIAASAGNHAQGLAESAKRMGVKATIVMPRTTPAIKVESVRARGAKVILHGDAFDEAFVHSQKLVAEQDLTYVHPFDDPYTIAGQGTVAVEILNKVRDPLHAVFIPVGGGGLIAGMAAYIKYLRPDTRVIGVEYEESACLQQALKDKARTILPYVGIFADGVAVAQIGENTWEICKDHVDEVITCNADEICAAIKDVFDDTRTVAEPAGALAIAGMKKYVEREQITGQTLVAVASGANMNFDRLRYVAERAEVGEKREVILAVTIPEQPGSFLKFCSLIGKRAITEFNYRYSDTLSANIFVGLKITEPAERALLLELLSAEGYPVVDLTDNEMAKAHVRHLVGGRVASVADERVYRFEFPERPGALLKFLKQLGKGWNISLFHYRNHGAAYGRVLVGLQVPNSEQNQIQAKLEAIGYQFWDESDNPSYDLFLR